MRKATALVIATATAGLLLAACSRPAPGSAGSKDAGGDDAPIPVTVVRVASQDVPIYFNGLGSVQAVNTATILAQVSGQLMAVPFKEGDEVQAGDLLAQVDPRAYQATLDQAIAKKAQDEATLAGDRLDLKRYQSLLPGGYVNGQQVDQEVALVKSAEALVKADDAAIEGDRVQLSYCTIRAPFAGVVGIRQVDVGNLVSATNQTGIVVLTQIKPITVTFTLPEQSLAQIRAADTQPLTVVAVNRDNQTELARGQLVAFDNQIDQSTGTIKIKASFANADKALWPGQFVNARLLVRTQHDALTVPSQAIQLGPNGSFVYLIDAQHKAHIQYVTTGAAEGGVTVIADGLSAGQAVVVDGQSRLQSGSTVQATESAAASPSPAAAAAESAAPAAKPQ
jgi:multidrug efflux system membrane fusion protein